MPASSGRLAGDISPWDGEIYGRVAAGRPQSIHSGSGATRFVSHVRSGIIHINDQGIGDEPMAPFGGVKNSGYGKFGGRPAPSRSPSSVGSPSNTPVAPPLSILSPPIWLTAYRHKNDKRCCRKLHKDLLVSSSSSQRDCPAPACLRRPHWAAA